jgi:hypothetical protein
MQKAKGTDSIFMVARNKGKGREMWSMVGYLYFGTHGFGMAELAEGSDERTAVEGAARFLLEEPSAVTVRLDCGLRVDRLA